MLRLPLFFRSLPAQIYAPVRNHKASPDGDFDTAACRRDGGGDGDLRDDDAMRSVG